MEMGFYDTNKTGDISSRLSSDTTSVSDQVLWRYMYITRCMDRLATDLLTSLNIISPYPQISLNINVMMRSVTQAILVLIFMLAASWRLTTITFVIIPLVMAVSSVRQ